MKKILVLDEFLCYPVDSGKKVRTYNILKQLSSLHRLTLLTYIWGDKNEIRGIEHLKSLGINVVAVSRNNPQKSGLSFYLRLFLNLFSSLPYIVAGHLSEAYSAELNKIIKNWKPDILLAEWSPYSIFFEPINSLPRVAVAHNLESSIWRGYVENSRNPIKRWYMNFQYKKVVKFENKIFNWLDGLILVSPIELEKIGKDYPGLTAALVDNGVDIEYFAKTDQPEEDDLISFVGSLDWRPNQDGVAYFIEKILPILRHQIDSLKVLIIGRGAPDWLLAFGKKHNVEFTGPVEDVRPHVLKSAVSIVPLRIGGGSRLKILEAFSMGKAVVSTSLGAEGLNVENKKHLIIADSEEAFANSVVRLLRDKEERRRLGENGRQLVKEKYQWPNLATNQSDFLNSIVDNFAGRHVE